MLQWSPKRLVTALVLAITANIVLIVRHPKVVPVATASDRLIKKYGPWSGGTGKAILMYSDRNERFAAQFPNWRPPVVETLTPFTDSSP